MTVLFAACQADPYKSPQGVRPDPLSTSAIPQQIVIEGLGQAIVSSKPMVNPAADGRTLHVTVPVRNITDQPLNVQYRFEFFDQQGKALRSNGGWVFQHIEPTLTAQLDGVALETKAVDWSVVIRPAH
jgi:uncharacterized protein YcfL